MSLAAACASTSVATLLPITPAGVGTEQAFLLYALSGVAPAAVLLAFVVSLAYFGASGGSSQGGQKPVVTVDGDAVSALAFERAYRAALEQARQALGDRWSDEMARTLRLREQVAQRLVEERLVLGGAAREGIVVADAELADQIVRIPAFQEAGQFSQERYRRVLALAQPPMTPAEFDQAIAIARGTPAAPLTEPEDLLDARIVGVTPKARAHGIDVATSCREGVCGTCLTRVIAGTPDHRDAFLSAKERKAGDKIMICVSRAKSAQLVLDL